MLFSVLIFRAATDIVTVTKGRLKYVNQKLSFAFAILEFANGDQKKLPCIWEISGHPTKIEGTLSSSMMIRH